MVFEEVLEIHAVKAGEERTGTDAEGADAEFEVEKHEGVAVGIKDGFDAGCGMSKTGKDPRLWEWRGKMRGR